MPAAQAPPPPQPAAEPRTILDRIQDIITPPSVRAEVAAAAGGPPPPVITAPPEPPSPAVTPVAPEEQGFFGRIRDLGANFLQGHERTATQRLEEATRQATQAVAPTTPTGQEGPSQAAMDALKAAAAGRAMALTADIRGGPGGPELVMQKQGGQADWETQAAQLTTPPTPRAAWNGGITAEDGTAFGNAAGDAVAERLKGVNIPAGGATAAPWEALAPKWTGVNLPAGL
jgi:hypothetical protein